MPTDLDEERRLEWRADELTRLGIDRGLALEYAAEVDYHDVKRIMDTTGWTVEQAFEMLRP